MEALLGGHRQIVSHIVGRIGAVSGGSKDVRVLVLRGPTGAGKSRIIREVYDELRGEQQGAPYWPDLRAGAARSMGPLGERKRIGPSPETMSWPAKCSPKYGWWTIDCNRLSDGSLLEVGHEVQRQMAAHGRPLLFAQLAKQPWTTISERQRANIRTLGERALRESGTEGLDRVLEAYGLILPGMGLVASALRTGHREISEWTHLRSDYLKNVSAGFAVHDGRKRRAADFAESILALTATSLPAIVAVEDLHVMGAEMSTVIDTLAFGGEQRPAVVIGTVWPDGMENPTFSSWFKFASEMGRVEVIDVPALSDADLTEIVTWSAPATDADQALRIVRQIRNPLMLELWLGLPATQQRIASEGGRLSLHADELKRLPLTFHAVIGEAWRELPPDVRSAVLTAVATVKDTGLRQWTPEVVVDAAVGGLGTAPNELEDGLRRAVVPAEWLVVESSIQRPREPMLALFLEEQVSEEFSVERLDSLRQATLNSLVRCFERWWNRSQLQLTAQAAVCVPWINALAPDGVEGDAQLAIWWLTAQSHANNGRWEMARAVGRRVLSPSANIDEERHLDWGREIARWAAQDNDLTTTITELDVLIARRSGVLRRVDVWLRRERAHWQCESGQIDPALRDLEALLPECAKVFGDNDRLTQAIEGTILRWQLERGDNIAREEFEELAVRQSSALPNDVLASKTEIALAKQRNGDLVGAIDDFRGIAAEAVGFFGQNSPQDWMSRGNLATAFGINGDLAREAKMLHNLRDDIEAHWGKNHAFALHARSNLAMHRERSGDRSGAVNAYASLLADRCTHLGSLHRETLKTKEALSGLTADSVKMGTMDVAAIGFKALHEYSKVAQGEDSPETLFFQVYHGICLYRIDSEQVDGLWNAYERVSSAWIRRIFGRDSRVVTHECPCDLG